MTPGESTRPDVPAHEVPAWSSPLEACRLNLRGVTLRTAAKVAAVVGTILTIVNQGSVIAGGDATAITWARVAVNYAVPFIVSSIGYLAPFRRRVPRTR